MLDPEPAAQWRIAFACAVVIAVVHEYVIVRICNWTKVQDWWPRVKALQYAMCQNFGFPEEMSEAALLSAWSSSLASCFIHAVSSLLMVGVILYGWEDATPLARDLFVLGTLTDVGFDIYHGTKVVLTTYGSDPVIKACGWVRTPAVFFVLMAIHHTLSLTLVIGMNVKYVSLTDYHRIAFSLLFAASVCYSLNAYKMTLDLVIRKNFIVFKAILVVQLFTILSTRAYMWVTSARRVLNVFAAEGDDTYWYAGVVAAVMMSLFNLALVHDVIETCVKWLPKPLPDSATKSKPQFIRELSRTSSIGTPPPF